MLKYLKADFTKHGEDILLTDSQERDLMILYSKNDNDIYEFAGIYDPNVRDENYPDGMAALPFRSVYGGVEKLIAGTSVWNVQGSTGDTFNGQSNPNWIALWKEIAGYHTEHPACYVAGSDMIVCNNRICGGHMVLTSDVTPCYGANDKVYIIPICTSHNNRFNTGRMKLNADVRALKLNRYHL